MTPKQIARLEYLADKIENDPYVLGPEEAAELEVLMQMAAVQIKRLDAAIKEQQAAMDENEAAIKDTKTAMISVADQLNTMWGTDFTPDEIAERAREIQAGRMMIVQGAPDPTTGQPRFIQIANDPAQSAQERYDQWLHNSPEGLERLRWEHDTGIR